MALRFRCEHCGKRLQVDLSPGAKVMCPYCKNAVTVPADAQVYNAGQPAAAVPQLEEGQGEEVEETKSDAVVGFLATYLPTWGTSVVLHLAVVLLSLMGTWMVVKPPEKVEYQAEIRQEQQKKFIRQERSAEKSRTTRRPETNRMSSFVFKRTENPIPDVANNQLRPIEVIGVGGGGQAYGGLAGFGTGRGGGGGGTDFFGIGGVARKIVYVVDRSGSMTDSIMYVKYELKRSIRMLKPNQSFYVVFYSSGPAVEMPSRKLVAATEANKMAAYEFIDGIVPVGQTDPSDALKRAFETQPELIYLLTDGEFDRKIVDLIDKLNAKKEVTVHTLCFIYTGGEPILQIIAQRNNGTYKYIGENDLESLGR
jgi:phage FluMu protein Com